MILRKSTVYRSVDPIYLSLLSFLSAVLISSTSPNISLSFYVKTSYPNSLPNISFISSLYSFLFFSRNSLIRGSNHSVICPLSLLAIARTLSVSYGNKCLFTLRYNYASVKKLLNVPSFPIKISSGSILIILIIPTPRVS